MDYFLAYHRAKQRAILRNRNMDHFTFTDRTPFEKVHLIFCKHLLGTKKTSSNLGVRAELGRFLVKIFINSQAILYLARLHTDNLNPLLKEAFELSKSLDLQGVYSWYTYVKKIEPDSVQINKVVSCKNLKDEIPEKYKNLYKSKIDKIDESSKLFLYKNLEPSLERKLYLSFNDFSIGSIFTKFLISDHSLEIEKGRYNKTPCEKTLCKNCGIIEDEAHFILKCKVNQNLRESLFNNIELDNEIVFLNFSD